jgi:hypothetical protein
VALLLIIIALDGCSQPVEKPIQTQTPSVDHGTGMGKGKNGSTSVNVQYLRDYIYSVKAGVLSEEEKEDLLHMVEEEKLARDVYQTLYQKWEHRIFSNIAMSEQTHMDAVRLLLEKYNLSDPTAGKGVGEFTNPKFKELYDALVEEGSKSLVDALKVGATVEELDIVDLQKCLNRTDKLDITTVYQNLMKGSRNHLRAFVWNLERLGESYEPKYLSKEDFEAIVTSDIERSGASEM